MFIQLKDYPDYFVNHEGIVASVKGRTWKYLKPFNSNGYLRVDLMVNGKRTRKAVHRLVMEAFQEVSDLTVNHKNGVKTDNRLSELEYCTQSDNVKHSVKTGLRKYNKGRPSKKRKLTEEDVRRMRDLYKTTKISHAKLGSLFGISASAAGYIVSTKTYNSVSSGDAV